MIKTCQRSKATGLEFITTIFQYFTCSEVEDNIAEKYGVRDNVEYNSTHGEVFGQKIMRKKMNVKIKIVNCTIIKERNSNRKYDEISYQKQEHANVPVEP